MRGPLVFVVFVDCCRHGPPAPDSTCQLCIDLLGVTAQPAAVGLSPPVGPRRCKAAGVDIIVDAVINHMANTQHDAGRAGSPIETKCSYPGEHMQVIDAVPCLRPTQWALCRALRRALWRLAAAPGAPAAWPLVAAPDLPSAAG